MVLTPLRYAGYEQSADGPNVVIDGSPNPGTVLVLSHWPGIPSPAGVEADTSCQMVFRYLDRGADLHGDARTVTNNHFDQDGLVSILALTQPDVAERHRELLIDLAAAGDFATYRHRAAARASMAIAAYGNEEVSPVAGQLRGRPYAEQCGLL